MDERVTYKSSRMKTGWELYILCIALYILFNLRQLQHRCSIHFEFYRWYFPRWIYYFHHHKFHVSTISFPSRAEWRQFENSISCYFIYPFFYRRQILNGVLSICYTTFIIMDTVMFLYHGVLYCVYDSFLDLVFCFMQLWVFYKRGYDLFYTCICILYICAIVHVRMLICIYALTVFNAFQLH